MRWVLVFGVASELGELSDQVGKIQMELEVELTIFAGKSKAQSREGSLSVSCMSWLKK